MRILDLLSVDYIQLGDNLAFELNEDLLIETTVIGFLEDGPIVQGDDVFLSYIETESLEHQIIESTISAEGILEAEYQGRKVPLGKPFLTPDGPKKRSVYVRNQKGNVVKVNFGDKTLRIKKSNPKRRKSFRARHHCKTPGPRHKARYWSCRAW